MAAWLDAKGIADGTPFLIAPDGGYDVELNSYWFSADMAGASRHTKAGSAREMRTFSDFLWNHRPPVAAETEGAESSAIARPRGWRDATVRDREVYGFWRCPPGEVRRPHPLPRPDPRRRAGEEAHETGWPRPAESGKAATVTALATRLGVRRQTLYRDFGPEVSDFLARDAERRTRPPRPPRDDTNDRKTIARLRREKDELTCHVHVYEDYIRWLTIENTRLTGELERLTAVTRLNRFRTIEDQ